MSEDFAEMDDSALISRRQQMRAQLQRLPPRSAGHSDLQAIYDQSTEIITLRARAAWMAGLAMADENTATACLLAVEMLLACPDTLNSALETELWLLRDQLIADEPKLGQHVPLRLSVRLAGILLTGVGDFPVVQLLSRDRQKAWDRGAADHSDGSW